ncbi:MAG: 30S ribosomal protein S2 [Planctomycetota bacterium]
MAAELVKQLIDAGVHFGHRASRWNPKMKPYIFSKRNLIHIINIKETIRGVLLAKKFIAQVTSEGKDVLLVGTKRQARKAVQDHADRVGMHWVNDRWLGGTLTNFREIRKRVGRLNELEAMDAAGQLDMYSKKAGSTLRREMRKIRRNLGGLRKMEKLPGVIIAIDQNHELIAVKEANKLDIPVICLLDTDGNPDLVDIPIPANDDAMRAIDLILKELCDAAAAGVQMRAKLVADDQDGAQRRRRRRATTARADDGKDADIAEIAGEMASEEPPAEPAAPAENQ